MKTTQGVVSVIPLGGSTGQMAILVDGIVTYVGSRRSASGGSIFCSGSRQTLRPATARLVELSVSPRETPNNVGVIDGSAVEA